MPNIIINGETRQITETLTVAALIESNGEIVPKSQHAATLLAAGDQLEIVVAVGGG